MKAALFLRQQQPIVKVKLKMRSVESVKDAYTLDQFIVPNLAWPRRHLYHDFYLECAEIVVLGLLPYSQNHLCRRHF